MEIKLTEKTLLPIPYCSKLRNFHLVWSEFPHEENCHFHPTFVTFTSNSNLL